MKFLKLSGVLLLFITGITAILSLVMPVKQKIKRSVTIKAPAAVVYEHLIKLENFNRWSVWNNQDSTVKNTITGTDGMVGASSSWMGDPAISGEGKIEIITAEENKTVSHTIRFVKPKKRNALSTFDLDEKNGYTTLTWNFDMATPRPWNIFNLLYSLDKQVGKDFDAGLAALKTTVEKNAGTAKSKTYQVGTMNFPATTFAIIRQQVKLNDMSTFFARHLPILFEEAAKVNGAPATASGLYYRWDEKNQEADIAAALAVPPGSKIDNPIIQLIDIPASKAVFVNYYGAYARLRDAYASIDEYLAAHNLKQKMPSIEQYFSGPFQETDTSKWLTKIVFLVQ